MALVAPPINALDVPLPPPTQDPPTIADVGHAQRYVNLLTNLRSVTANVPTDAEIGAAKLYLEEVVSKCATAVARPPWLVDIAARIDNLTDTVGGLTNTVNITGTVDNLAGTVDNLTSTVGDLTNTINTRFADLTNNVNTQFADLMGTINRRFDEVDRQMEILENTL